MGHIFNQELDEPLPYAQNIFWSSLARGPLLMKNVKLCLRYDLSMIQGIQKYETNIQQNQERTPTTL